MKKVSVILLAMFAVLFAASAVADDKDKGDKAVRVFEIRTYYAAEGKMDALSARFRDHTCKLFEKHGMKNIGYWQAIEPKDGKQVLIYILAHESEDAAKKSWEAFQDDPDWKKVKEESEKDGALVDRIEKVFVKATDYSPIK
jgi:hypothetical protein